MSKNALLNDLQQFQKHCQNIQRQNYDFANSTKNEASCLLAGAQASWIVQLDEVIKKHLPRLATD